MPELREKGAEPVLIRRLLGFLLLLPAVFVCILVLAIPTLSTVMNSFQKMKLIPDAPAEFIGFENYSHLFADSSFLKAWANSWSPVPMRVLLVLIVPLLLAFLVNEFGLKVRVPIRLLFTIPLALFAPAAAALAWIGVYSSNNGLLNTLLTNLGVNDPPSWLNDTKLAPGVLSLFEGYSAFMIACGVGIVFFLAAFRGAGDGAPSWKSVWRPLVISWGVGLLAAIVLPFPAFTASYVLGGAQGGPGGVLITLGEFLFRTGFIFADLGSASAIATIVLFLVLPAGFLAGLMIILGGLRLEMVPRSKPSALWTGPGKPSWTKPLAIVMLALVLLFSVMVCTIYLMPGFWNGLTSLKSDSQITRSGSSFWPMEARWENYEEALRLISPSLGRVWVNTILPPLIAILLIQIPVGYLAALGIGLLRPLGRRSEWLLLPFSPWLLITTLPLGIAFFRIWSNLGLLETWSAAIPPIVISIPMLFILTLFFKGQEPKWRAARAAGQTPARAFLHNILLPSLPLTALLASVSLLLSMQDLFWPLLATSGRPENSPISLALLRLNGLYGIHPPIIAAASILLGWPVFAFFLVVFGLFQTFYLDRLALTADRADAAEGKPFQPR